MLSSKWSPNSDATHKCRLRCNILNYTTEIAARHSFIASAKQRHVPDKKIRYMYSEMCLSIGNVLQCSACVWLYALQISLEKRCSTLHKSCNRHSVECYRLSNNINNGDQQNNDTEEICASRITITIKFILCYFVIRITYTHTHLQH